MLAAAGVAADEIRFRYGARRPLPRPGQRDHDLGRRGPTVAGRPTTTCVDRVRGRLPADLRPDDPRRRRSRPSRGGSRPSPRRRSVEPLADRRHRQPARRTAAAPVRFGRGHRRGRHAGLPPRRPRRRPASSPARPSSRSARRPRSSARAGRSTVAADGSLIADERPRSAVSDDRFDPIELEVLWQSLIATVNEQARALQRAAFSPDRARGRRPRQRGVRPPRPDGRAGRHRHARAHQLAGPGGRRRCSTSTRPTRSSRATCSSPTIRTRRPASCSTSPCCTRCSATAGSSRSSARRSTTPTSAATASAPAPATCSRKACGSRSAS